MECTRGKGKNTLATQDVVSAPLVFSGVHLTHGRSLFFAVQLMEVQAVPLTASTSVLPGDPTFLLPCADRQRGGADHFVHCPSRRLTGDQRPVSLGRGKSQILRELQLGRSPVLDLEEDQFPTGSLA